VRVDVLEPSALAAEFLGAREGVSSLRIEATRITFAFVGDDGARAALLKELVAHGVAVTAFTPERSRIETLLMSLVEEGRA
jgi:hypothetical protein